MLISLQLPQISYRNRSQGVGYVEPVGRGGEGGVSVPFKENNLIVAYLAETVVIKELDQVINLF